MDWYPLRFRPIYQPRVWGGHALAELYGRALPGDQPIGESWEIADRPEGLSVVADGPLAGRSLRELMAADEVGLLGGARSRGGRFPLLVKILDARDTLSLQVHPPTACAAALGGESKTEMWYFTAAEAGARILAGLRPGSSRAEFERRLQEGTVGDCFHSVVVRPGDAFFLPSGRVHALGAGLVLFEIQENSDTTYRVFDWNRVGLDGKPRDLHVSQALASIDFDDLAPAPVRTNWEPREIGARRELVRATEFSVDAWQGRAGTSWSPGDGRCRVVGVVRGRVEVAGGKGDARQCRAGDFVLLPAVLRRPVVRVVQDAEWLVAEPGVGG